LSFLTLADLLVTRHSDPGEGWLAAEEKIANKTARFENFSTS
jgi:hypothetical protein